MRVSIGKRITLVSEAAFQHKLWAPKLDFLKKIARIRLIHCSISAHLAKSRFIQRGLADPERKHFHDDWARQKSEDGIELLNRGYEPPKLMIPTLTSEQYQPTFEEIVAFIQNS